ncbi:protein stoned-B-like isoform X2 [Portunus trituberculatus]|uniref:protein stoned-B-like isoform X2 n=1 Tax=Portunus trituberculatus TaxID=210409 RepID=UPI001E1CE3C5|nr:protein stoned-B-like isoform X2 [Portunus trituberculatus]
MDFSGNVKNPFLFDDPAPPADVGDTAANPFLMGGAFDYSAVSYTGINPFSDQIDDSNAAAAGLFGDPAAYPSDMNPFGVAAQPFGDMTKESDLFGTPVSQGDLFGGPEVIDTTPMPQPAHPTPPARPPAPSSPVVDLMNDSPPAENTAVAPGRPPPPRPPPPSKETKDLLQTVIGAMEATTDTLHEKLTTTRTPCPSPGSGAPTSRSPTPDIQITSPKKDSDAFSAIFGQTIDMDSDHEIEETKSTANADVAAPTSTSDDFDLFGDTPVQKPRTNQDILSLFNKPQTSQSPQVDLLSDDLPEADSTAENEETDKQSISDLLSGATIEDSKPTPSPDEVQVTSATPSLSEEVTVNDTAAIAESPAKSDGPSDMIPLEESVSPEQVSEKTDSEPTVIEAADQDTGEEICKISVAAADAPDTSSVGEEKIEAMEVFGSPEPMPPTINSEHSNSSNSSSHLSTPVKAAPAEPSINEDDQEDQNNEENTDAFGMSDVPSSNSEQVNAFGDKSAPATDAFGEIPTSTPAIDSFGEVPASVPETDAFGVIPDTFGTSTVPDKGAELFGDTSGPFASSIPTGDALFGGSSGASLFGDVPQTVPPDSSAAGLFGDVSQVAPPGSPANSLFSEAGQAAPPASPAAGLFGNTPSSGSSAFDIFGSSTAPVSAPSGADSTGAALFGSSAPAPNVGMSLFGGGAEPSLDIFAESEGNSMVNPFAQPTPAPASVLGVAPKTGPDSVKVATDEEFDAFSARFDNAGAEGEDELHHDPFASTARAASPWGDTTAAGGAGGEGFGFGDSSGFDPFLALNEPPPVPQSTPRRTARQPSGDSDEGTMSVVIKPAGLEASGASPRTVSPVPVLAPPPAAVGAAAFTDTSPRFNPFDRGAEDVAEAAVDAKAVPGALERTDSQETPPTPLFEEDQSQPLEPFPRTHLTGTLWEMHLRQPNKKKITGQRFWKKVFVKLTEGSCLQLFNSKDDKDPFQELPLQACYSVSDIGAQQFDQFGKIFTVKVQYIFYKERPGVRPGQVSKAERLTTKISKFAQHAIAGDYEHVKEFASDVRKLGMPVEHAPQISQLLKLGTQNYEDLKVFSSLVEEQLFKLTVHRDRALNYKSEEVQLTAVDEIYVEQDLKGVVHRMIARVRIFFLGFLSGMPDVDLGINDMRKQGREVVGRHDIIPVITEEWIRLEAVEFHCCVDGEEFEKTQHIKYKPPDACYIELMRFRVRPPKNRELPLQVKTKITIEGRRVDISCEILVPGFSGRKLGQVPCEDVVVRFPLPECWIYMFRVEKHFRYGSVKSAHRRTGKVKGIERLMGTVETPESALMEVTSGQAKYEHQHRAIVWRMSRLPKEGQGAYTQHSFSCRMSLTAYDQMPESFDKYCYVEFTMPATTVSHCVMRSVSITSEDPPEKYVRYLARHEYRIEMEFCSGSGPSEYLAATMKASDQLQKEKEEEARKQDIKQQQNNESSSDDSS